MTAEPSNLKRWHFGLVIATAAIIAIAGALPHLFFMHDTGGCNFFENAWDESFYALAITGKISGWNDYPLRVLQKFLMALTGGPNCVSAIVSDVLWPFAVALAAGFLTLSIVRNRLAIVPVMVGLVFASEIFSFNSSIVYPATISKILGLLPLDVRKLFSDPFVPFLYAYRTPEPQLSLPFFFVYFALVVRFVRASAVGLGDWFALSVAAIVCVTIYPFLAAASLMIGGLGALSLLLTRRWRAGILFMALVFVCALTLAVIMIMSHSGEASAMRFQSHLPLLAPSIVYGAVLLPVFFWTFRNRLQSDAQLTFALLCYLVPFATLNQQIVTGQMFQTVNWERFVNYPSLVVATVILLGRIDWNVYLETKSRAARILLRLREGWAARNPRAAVSICLIVLAVFLYRGQLNNYRQFAPYNLLTLAYAKAIDQFYAAHPDANRRVTLSDMSYDAQVRVRLKTADVIFNGYTDLVAAMKAPEKEGGQSVAISTQREWGFEHAARFGLSKGEYEAHLVASIDNRGCFSELMYQFTFLQCAPYVSDFRNYSPTSLKAALPGIADGYRQFLTARAAKRDLNQDALVLSTTELPAGDVSSLWTQAPAGTLSIMAKPSAFARNLSAAVHIYWQKAIRG
ncbi:MAG: hypothetical protein HY242_05575 [Afipia sp.]|nr:hypothetical protein [Afipia sp.]